MKLYKNEKRLFCCLCALLAAGLIVLIVSGAMLIKQSHYIKNGVESDFLISHTQTNEQGKEEYIATYIENGERVETVYKGVDKNTYIGETLKIYYMQDNPEKQVIVNGRNREQTAFKISCVESICVLALVLIIFLPLRRRTQLLENGSWKLCRVKSIEKQYFGRCRILCDSSEFPQRKKKPFYSMSVKKEWLPKKIKEQSLSVYYDENNPNRYYVKTDDFRGEEK